MKVLIETYRGYQIEFCTDPECFITEGLDDWGYRHKTLKLAKTHIDQYIKENETFTPIVITHKHTGKKIKVIGIRKDKKFTYKDEDGKTSSLSTYVYSNFIIYNPENDILFEEMSQIEDEIALLQGRKQNIQNKVTGKPLTEYRKEMGW